MAANDHKKGPGGHYSASNPIPNIQKFIANMDADKKERDARVTAEHQARRTAASSGGGSDVKDHDNGQPKGVEGTLKVVTDPTTGNEVEIEDVNANFMKAVENPQLSVPNANIGKEAVSIYLYAPRQ